MKNEKYIYLSEKEEKNLLKLLDKLKIKPIYTLSFNLEKFKQEINKINK
jgi:hypothetical protein